MFKGPVGPNSGRTPRSIAEEQGTNPSGFKEGPPYDYAAGHPITKNMPSQAPKETELKPGGDAKPMEIPAPFTVSK